MLSYLLVVDHYDNETAFQSVVNKTHRDYRLLYTRSGKESLRILRRLEPIVVLINFQLADLSSLDCAQRLTSIRSTQKVYIYNEVITPQLQLRAKFSGASGCLSVRNIENDIFSFLKGLNKN